MLSISDDSASARKPTWPRLTPSSGMSDGDHPLRAAQDGAVAAEHDHQLDAVGRRHRLGQRGDRVGAAGSRWRPGPRPAAPRRCPAAPRPSISRVAAATAAGRPMWVSTATRRGDRVGRSGAGSRRRSVTWHSIGSAPVGGRERSTVRRARPGSSSSRPGAARRQQHEELPVAGRPRAAGWRPPPGPPAGSAALRPPRRRPRRGAARARGPRPPLPSRSRPTSNWGLTISSSDPSRGGHRGERPEQQGQGDERDVGHHQVDRLAADVVEGQVAQVGLLAHPHPRVARAAAAPAGRCRRRPRPPRVQPRSSSTWVKPPVDDPGVQGPAPDEAEVVERAEQLVGGTGDVAVARRRRSPPTRRPARPPCRPAAVDPDLPARIIACARPRDGARPSRHQLAGRVGS